MGSNDLRKSTVNIFLDIIIFVLIAVIILMSWSLYNKLRGGLGSEEIELKSEGVASEIIQVEVLNGCGVTGVADRFTDYLRANDFDVVNIGNYISFDIDETMVIDRIGNLANAKKIAESLNVNSKNVLTQINNSYLLDVSVIIGKDYFKLNPLH